MTKEKAHERQKRRIKDWKIRTKLVLLILVMAVVSLCLYQFLWRNQRNVADLLEKTGLVTWFDTERFIEEFSEAAKDYEVPDSEGDAERKAAIRPLLERFADEYTGVSIYGTEIGDATYRCGITPDILNNFVFTSLLSNSQVILGEESGMYPMEFANGTYDVVYYSYSKSRLTYPYVAVSVILCVAVFLSGILVFVRRMVKRVSSIQDAISRISTGDLDSPVPPCGGDEIGVVASELDAMRETLAENIRREDESRQANRDLITAVSHDLRTPLTVLSGYLEVLRLKRTDPESAGEYIDRCLKKAGDIRALTDRMFEYALVYEEDETPQLKKISAAALNDCIQENCDFIRIAGFDVAEENGRLDGEIYADEIMLKRIFSNLFSNILKYGDKREPVSVSVRPERGSVRISVANRVREDTGQTESNRIGLRSARRMAELHGGGFYTFREAEMYTVTIRLDLT